MDALVGSGWKRHPLTNIPKVRTCAVGYTTDAAVPGLSVPLGRCLQYEVTKECVLVSSITQTTLRSDVRLPQPNLHLVGGEAVRGQNAERICGRWFRQKWARA